MTLAKLEEIPANQRKDLPKDQVYLRELTAEEVAYTDMVGYKGRVFERKNVKISIETVPDERPKIFESIPDLGPAKAAQTIADDRECWITEQSRADLVDLMAYLDGLFSDVGLI